MLTPHPPHKKKRKITRVAHRLKMVELAIEDNPKFSLSRVDIDRQPPHYAVDTMSLLRDQAPGDEFYYLMGLDSLNDLLTWHRPVDFVELCHCIAVMIRRGEILDISRQEAKIPGLVAKLYFLQTPIIEISATDIRKRVECGEQYRYFVPEKICRYIAEKRLYLD